MTWTKEFIQNQHKDLTPYTETQMDYLVHILNTIEFPWRTFVDNNVELKIEPGAFGAVFALFIDGRCYMTNSAHDLLDHRSIIEQAHGDVLLTGLGMGLGVLFCNANENVKSVTVIENNSSIIENITPVVIGNRIPVEVINHDANAWVPHKQFDFAYIDHAYEKADETPYIPFCNQIISWWDERQELIKTWQ